METKQHTPEHPQVKKNKMENQKKILIQMKAEIQNTRVPIVAQRKQILLVIMSLWVQSH